MSSTSRKIDYRNIHRKMIETAITFLWLLRTRLYVKAEFQRLSDTNNYVITSKRFPIYMPVTDRFPIQRSSYAESWYFICCFPSHAVEQTVKLSVVWDTKMVVCRHCNGTEFFKTPFCKWRPRTKSLSRDHYGYVLLSQWETALQCIVAVHCPRSTYLEWSLLSRRIYIIVILSFLVVRLSPLMVRCYLLTHIPQSFRINLNIFISMINDVRGPTHCFTSIGTLTITRLHHC